MDRTALAWALVIGIVALLVFPVFLNSLTVTTRAKLSESGAVERIDLSGWPRVGTPSDRFVVYYSPSLAQGEALAREAREYLAQAERIAQERVGLSLGRLGLALLPYRPGLGEAVIRHDRRTVLQQALGLSPLVVFPLVVPPDLRTFTEAPETVRHDLYWVTVHEGIERSIGDRLYWHDRRLRWVGDGLAEYVAFTVTKDVDPEVACLGLEQQLLRLRVGLRQGVLTYDLTEDFLVRVGAQGGAEGSPSEGDRIRASREQVGYGLAFAFWYEVALHHGEETIRRFWERVRREPIQGLEDVLRILADLTAEDVGGAIRNVSVQEALEFLKISLKAHTTYGPCRF